MSSNDINNELLTLNFFYTFRLYRKCNKNTVINVCKIYLSNYLVTKYKNEYTKMC